MKKRTCVYWAVGVWIAAALICVGVVCAAATDDNIAIVNNPVKTDFLNLREEASMESKSIGRYFNGTQVVVEGAFGEWTAVQIGNAKGYMKSEFLQYAWERTVDPAPVSDMAMGSALWGVVRTRLGEASLGVQEAADANAKAIGELADGDVLQILGTVGEGWLHVRSATGELTGYVPDEWVIGGLMQIPDGDRVVLTGDQESAPLLSKPGEDGRVLCELYSGIVVYTFGTVNDYTLIKLPVELAASQYGYIETKFLREGGQRVEESRLYFANVALPEDMPSAALYMRPSEGAEVIGTFQNGAEFIVFGETDDFYLVNRSDYQGFIRKDCLNVTDTPWTLLSMRYQNALGYGTIRTGDKQYAPLLKFSEDNGRHIVALAEEGDSMLVINSEGEWAQGYYLSKDESRWVGLLFVQTEYLELLPIPAFQDDAAKLAFTAGDYTVGEDLPADLYTFRVPGGKEGTLIVTIDGKRTEHSPVPEGRFCIYSLYLPEGARITIEKDGVLTDLDKTWVWGETMDATYSGGYGRFLAGVHIDESGMQLKLLPGATEGYYRVIPIEMDANGILPEPVYLKPGETAMPTLNYGVFLEVYNCFMWTNG